MGYGVRMSALASSAPEISKSTARKPRPYKRRQLSFCGNIVHFLWKLRDLISYILPDNSLYFGEPFCLMCRTEDEGSRTICTASPSLVSNLMDTALRTRSLVYEYFLFVICIQRPFTPNFKRVRKITESDY
jgi:citrate synthase